MTLSNLARALARDDTGSMAIETAIVAPVLALMSVGGFEVSTMVARQSELQSAASEAEAIALAVAPETESQRNTVKQVIMASTGLTASQVTLSTVYRCGAATVTVTTSNSCGSGVQVATYLRMVLTDRYTPTWTEFGIGDTLDYNVTRTVMVS